MDSPQLKEEYPLKHILNNNRFLSNEMCSNSTFSDNIVNCNLNKSIDENYLSNNINTNVTFDNEIKTTYTINNSTNRARGQYLISNNETPGLEAASCFQTDNQNIIDFNRVSKRNDINLLSDDFSGTKFDISQTNTKNFTHNENNCPFRNDILSNVSQNDRTNKTDVNENICDNVNDHNINNDMKDDIGNLICNEHCATEDNQNQVINKTGSVGQFSRSHKIKVVDDQYNQRIYNEGKDKELVNLVSTLEKSSENHDKTVSNDDNTTTNKCVDKTPEQSIDTLVNNDDIKTPFELEPSKKNKHEESSINSNMKLVNQSIGMEGNKSIGGTNYSYIRQTTEPAILTKSQSMKNIGASSVHKNEINKPSSPQESCRNFYDKGYSDSKNNVHVRHDKFLNTLKQLKEKQLRASEQSLFENSLARERSKHYRDTYKRRLNKVTFEDDERPLHTINYAHGEFEDGYLSGYKNDMSFSRDRTRISPGCASTGKQYPGSRGSLRRSAKSSSIRNDGKENLSNFDVYNIETAMPYIDLEAIENHLIAATKEERRRRNDREEIRKRLANGTDPEPTEKGGRRKPNLQTRLQNGMNLQICFMNETMSDDNESPNSDAEPKSLPPNNNSNKSHYAAAPKHQPQSLSCHISNTNKTSKYTRPSPNKLTLPLKNVYTSNKVSSVADFFARQAELQVEARKALTESKDNARRLMLEERENHPVSPITEIIRTSLHKVGITFPKDRRRLSRQLLTDMNVAQLQVIVNDLHTQIEYLNEKLVRYLMERDELHMTQDSMLVDIEDLTRYLSAKQKSLKHENMQNNNGNMFSSLKPQMNRIATLVKK